MFYPTCLYAGFAIAAVGGEINGIGRGESWGTAARVAASAIIGGTVSAIGGGKFANGAVSGAFVRLFNEEAAHYLERNARLDLTGKDGSVLFVEDSRELGSAGEMFRYPRQAEFGNARLDLADRQKGQTMAEYVKDRLGDRVFDNIVLGLHGDTRGAASKYMEAMYKSDSPLITALASHLSSQGSVFIYQCYGVCLDADKFSLSKAFGYAKVWSALTTPYPTMYDITARVSTGTGSLCPGKWLGVQASRP